MYAYDSSDHSTRMYNNPLNANDVVFEPSSMLECVQVMKGHVDGFANALNVMIRFLDNEDDLMSALGVTDQDEGEILKQIKLDEGISIFEQLSKGDSAQSWTVAAHYAERSKRILETVNTFFRYFGTHDDTKKTLTTHRVIDRLENLSIRCNEARETICAPIMKFHEETKLFLEIIAAMMYPLGAKWEVLRMELFLRKSLGDAENFPLILRLKGQDGYNNLFQRSDDELSALLLALERLNFRQNTICGQNLDRARNENSFLNAMQFMIKKQIYVDTKYTKETKRALICFYLGITKFIQAHLGGFKVVRKGPNAGSCFTQVIGTSSGTHTQAMDSSAETYFPAAGTSSGAGTGAGAPLGTAIDTPFPAASAGTGTGAFFAASGTPFGTTTDFPATSAANGAATSVGATAGLPFGNSGPSTRFDISNSAAGTNASTLKFHFT